jgi:DNA-binding transcriptional LysR family regulator
MITWLGAWAAMYALTLLAAAWRVSAPSTIAPAPRSVARWRICAATSARRAAVTLPQNAGAPFALPGTNLVATLNKRLVDRYADDPALAVVAAPVELEPFQYFMVWHPRLDHDAAQQWLRETIRSVAAATVGGPSGRR